MGEWISVKDRLPDWHEKRYPASRVRVIILAFGRVYMANWQQSSCYSSPYWWTGSGYLQESEVTHWQPLPEPPKDFS